MSFSVFRAPLRNAAAANPMRRAARLPRTTFRTTFYRKYSEQTTPPPPPAPEAKSSNTALYVGIGAAAVGALAYYFYNTEAENTLKSGLQIAKVKANFVPTKDDYQKARSSVCQIYLFNVLTVRNLRSTRELLKLLTRLETTTVSSRVISSSPNHRLTVILLSRRLLRTCHSPSCLAFLWNVRQGLQDWWKACTFS